MLKNPSPAVSIAMIRGTRILLVRRARAPSLGLYAFPGGRVEAGETSEHAARRELMEETGLVAGELELHREFHVEHEAGGAPIDFTLRVFSTTWQGDEPVADDDASEAGWFTLDQMETMPVIASVMEVAYDLLSSQTS
ncbi:NUDIX hydrolase [Mesorhizobium sp. NBSH29]|uniref:NUDIX hydrolase n=1 Tax=Mesorhizobium sp. NBSH29 TaxID=2654249 RepID=UPI0021560FFF|nr:NUDIX domain-containing protein [Mesorhizobium sp. NBSH29]